MTVTQDHIRCDGCGHVNDCLVVSPTLDDTKVYAICQVCVHNATRSRSVSA
jgi:hypothetical protein